MNKETSLHGFTVMEGYVGYLHLDINQLQTVRQCPKKQQHKTPRLLRLYAGTNPQAICKSVNLYPPH